MTLKDRWNRFLERATEMHGDKFVYFEEEFVNYKTPMKIICPVHGEFKQAPDKHISNNSKGCPQCWEDMKSNVLKNVDRSNVKTKAILSKEEFLNRVNQKFQNKFSYDLTNYTGFSGAKIKITCPTHGEFEICPQSHFIAETGCKKCGLEKRNKTSTKEYEFAILQLQEKHSSFYQYPDYNRENYINKRSKIDIFCPKHGIFQKTAQKHLSGQGCWGCKVEQLIRDNILVGGYSEDLFKDRPELCNLPSVLYYLKINNGEFYKIGISRYDANSRFKGLKHKSKGKIHSIELIWEESDSLYKCFKKEQLILSQYSQYRVFENWSTELFNRDVISLL